MKCLLVADLHYDLRKFDWVVDAACHVDLVVLAGDHLDAGSTVPRPAQAVIVQRYFRRIREVAPLLVCSGNHDLDGPDRMGGLTTRWLARSRHFDVLTDGQSRVFGDTLFSLCPWCDSKGQERGIAAQLAAAAALRPERWVWVHHAPPAASPVSWDGKRCFGDVRLREWIEAFAPEIVLSGHVHQSPFTKDGSWADRIGRTWVFNAGHQIGPRPAHIVVDLEEPGAYWTSLAGAELVPLDVAPERPFSPVDEPPPWLLALYRTT